eukprot:TRINITY_DN7641_c0_g1_i1.p1 TRINITY_DN7641_c0_g1~~TRINITY_DN7641_c0_g1_i1.p1  ORF type:complete len:1296 (+),score=191.81 TRINITY_DN7641_c0_g1_i1:64-3951(+)
MKFWVHFVLLSCICGEISCRTVPSVALAEANEILESVVREETDGTILENGVPYSGTLNSSAVFTISVPDNYYILLTIDLSDQGWIWINEGNAIDWPAGNLSIRVSMRCAQDVSLRLAGLNPPTTFNLTADLVSSVLQIGQNLSSFAATDGYFAVIDYWKLNITETCSNISIMMKSPQQNKGFLKLEGSPCRASDSCSESDLFPTLEDDRYKGNYYALHASCLPVGIYQLSLDTLTGQTYQIDARIKYQYEIFVEDALSANCNCSSNGVCFRGKCWCQRPFKDAKCNTVDDSISPLGLQSTTVVSIPLDGVAFAYSNFNSLILANRNLIITFSAPVLDSVSAHDELGTATVGKGGFNRDQLIYEEEFEGGEIYTFEICTSAATDFIMFSFDSYYEGVNVSIMASFVERILDEDAVISAEVDGYSDQYLLQGPLQPNFVASLIYDAPSLGFTLVPASLCAFFEYRTKNNIYGVLDTTSSVFGEEGVNQLRLSQDDCSGSSYYSLFIWGAHSNYTLELSAERAVCNQTCQNGVCLNGTCSCYRGFTGENCAEATYRQVIIDQTLVLTFEAFSYEDQYFYFENPNAPFRVHTDVYADPEECDVSAISVYFYYAQVGFPSVQNPDEPQCDLTGDLSGIWQLAVVRLDAENCEATVYLIVESILQDYIINANFPNVVIPWSGVRVYEIGPLALDEEIHVEIRTTDLLYINTGLDCSPSETVFEDVTLVFSGCTMMTPKTYLTISAQQQTTAKVKITNHTVTPCPNCCSRIGICNMTTRTCECPIGYNGVDCSIPTPGKWLTRFCNFSHTYTIHPKTAAELINSPQQYCNVSHAVYYLDAEITSSIPTYFVGDCRDSFIKVLCESYFIPVTDGHLVPDLNFLSSCRQQVKNCQCSGEIIRGGFEATCEDLAENMDFYLSMFSFEGESSTSPNASDADQRTIIAGILVGSILFLTAVIAAAYLIYRRRLQNKPEVELPMAPLITTPVMPVLKDITVGTRLGSGNFGEVFLGIWNGTNVALKKLKTSEDEIEFEKELGILFHIGAHPSIVQFLGKFASPRGEKFIVMEYLPKGNVAEFLQLEKNQLTINDLMDLILSVTNGLLFLEKRNILHRDLSARNLLVTRSDDKYSAKISDFGMSRETSYSSSYYTASSSKVVPIRWSAPEVILYKKYSPASEIWSFGIVMWEILSYGALPYAWLSNREVAEQLPQGLKLSRPTGEQCSAELWNIIVACFHQDPHARPNIKDIAQQLWDCERNRRGTASSGDLAYQDPDMLTLQTSSSKNGLLRDYEVSPNTHAYDYSPS